MSKRIKGYITADTSVEEIVDNLNELGKEGWILVSVYEDRSQIYDFTNFVILAREINNEK